MQLARRPVVERRHTNTQGPVGISAALAKQAPFIGVEPGKGGRWWSVAEPGKGCGVGGNG
jgi:hypothetical protein